MKELNILLGYCPVYGKDLAKRLLMEDNIRFCYHVADGYCYEEEDGKLVCFNWSLGMECAYEKVFDLNQFPALCKDILEKMLPYESMAINLGTRTTNYPIVNYEEEKNRYYKHLRFWNYIFDHYEINAVYFEEIPHRSYTYIIYSLAIIKKIPILINAITSIPNIRVIGDRIEFLGSNIQAYYKNICSKMAAEECILSGSIKDFVEKYTQPIQDIKKDRYKQNFEKEQLEKTVKNFYGKYWGINSRILPVQKKMAMLLSILKKEKSWQWYCKNRVEIDALKKECYDIRFYMKNVAMPQSEYNKIAILPDYSKKYIYFALQLMPEETTMPRAGVFASQYNSIQLLARAAEKEGVLIYVKEHFVQAFRSRFVYEEIKKIPNVYLIKTTESSFDLMNNSIAVATQTGTCILESALKGKPSLVTSSGAVWKGLPSMFEVVDENQGADIIRNILDGFEVNADEIMKYFYAIQECSVECFYQWEWWKQREMSEHKDSVDRLLKLIKSYFKENI